MLLKFKAEISLLLLAIVLYSVSTFCYFYEPNGERIAFALSLNYPYRELAVPLVGFSSAIVVVATISYSRRSKATNTKKDSCRTRRCS